MILGNNNEILPKLIKPVIKAFNKRAHSLSLNRLQNNTTTHNNSLNSSTENLKLNYKSNLREKSFADKPDELKLKHNDSVYSGPYSTLNEESMNKSTISLNWQK